jgi:N-acyl homoserine lactone hydrolase
VSTKVDVGPWVAAIPTPGHTAGHQSLVVEQADGAVVLAGQAYHFTSDFAMDELARRAGRQGAAQPLPGYQPWLDGC